MCQDQSRHEFLGGNIDSNNHTKVTPSTPVDDICYEEWTVQEEGQLASPHSRLFRVSKEGILNLGLSEGKSIPERGDSIAKVWA